MQISASHYSPYVQQQFKTGGPGENDPSAMPFSDRGAENFAGRQAKSVGASISNEVQAALITAQETQVFDKPTSAVQMATNKGDKSTDLDQLFSDDLHAPGKRLLGDLPPLLFPSAENIEAISQHASARFREMLAQYAIPSAPREIVYNNEGKMQLPADYPYVDELESALKDNPGLERELHTLNGMSSQYAELQKRVPFHEEYSKASSQAEADQIVRRYSHLFQDNQKYSRIALVFSDSGELSITADGKRVLGHGTS